MAKRFIKIITISMFVLWAVYNYFSPKAPPIKPIEVKISEKDKAEMVLVPAGEFLMGSENGNSDEKPQHAVYLDTYWLYKTEVTNAQYAKCVESGNCSEPVDPLKYKDSNYAQHPVVNVDWEQAKRYCIWAGGRLPSEAQWEKGARGTDGRTYPWGNQSTPQEPRRRGNSGFDRFFFPCDKGNIRYCDNGFVNFMKFSRDTEKVGSYPQGASPYGALDMAGNVAEWVNDGYAKDYYVNAPRKNPEGPAVSDRHVIRGGSMYGDNRDVRSAARAGPGYTNEDGNGFRCAFLPSPTPPSNESGSVENSPTVTEKAAAAQTAPGEVKVSEKDGMEQVYVPAGEFLMGSGTQTIHSVYLNGYWIDKTEVTNAMFSRFIDEKSYKTEAEEAGSGYVYNAENEKFEETQGTNWQHPEGPSSSIKEKENYPVLQVSWKDAKSYCKWKGGGLPTEAQWEKAARGIDGRMYPWGNQKPTCDLANFEGCGGKTKKVGSLVQGASPYGALDMAGNVYEWVQDWYSEGYYANSPREDPTGPETGKNRVLRGGSWRASSGLLKGSFRLESYPSYWHGYIGFRCVSLPSPTPPSTESGSVENIPTTAPPTEKAAPGQVKVSEKDGMEQVYVPAGEFLMGSTQEQADAAMQECGSGCEKKWIDSETPQHAVYLDGYWIDKTEVSNAMFSRFVDEKSYKTEAEEAGSGYVYNAQKNEWEETKGANWQHPDGPSSSIKGKENHPVLQLWWNDARSYCEWAGGRLPSEAQWEKAARGTDGRKYPWGNQEPTCDLANFGDCGGKTKEVGSLIQGASPYGAFDMAGNVWEFVEDWYSEGYYANSPRENPRHSGPQTLGYRFPRGGANNNEPVYLRTSNRNPADGNDGFRCVR